MTGVEAWMNAITRAVGNPVTIPLCIAAVVALYAVAGVDIANISISIATLLLLPILQHSQNRDGLAIQVKLDELIRSSEARNELIGLDKKTEKEIERRREL